MKSDQVVQSFFHSNLEKHWVFSKVETVQLLQAIYCPAWWSSSWKKKFFLISGEPKLDTVSRCTVTSAEYRGIIASLGQWVVLLLMHPRMLLTFFAPWTQLRSRLPSSRALQVKPHVLPSVRAVNLHSFGTRQRWVRCFPGKQIKLERRIWACKISSSFNQEVLMGISFGGWQSCVQLLPLKSSWTNHKRPNCAVVFLLKEMQRDL